MMLTRMDAGVMVPCACPTCGGYLPIQSQFVFPQNGLQSLMELMKNTKDAIAQKKDRIYCPQGHALSWMAGVWFANSYPYSGQAIFAGYHYGRDGKRMYWIGGKDVSASDIV